MKLKIIAIAAFMCSVMCAEAIEVTNGTGTNSINLPLLNNTALVSTNTLVAVQDAVSWFEPLIPYLTNSPVSLDVGPLWDGGKHWGAYGDLRVYPANTASLGVGVAYAQDDWFVAPVSLKLGTPLNWPVIGKYYVWGTGGLALRVRDGAMGTEVGSGVIKSFDINPTTSINIGGGTLYFSQQTKPNYLFNVSFTHKF
jgi:hypothetical protein